MLNVLISFITIKIITTSIRGGHQRGPLSASNGGIISNFIVSIVDALFEIKQEICCFGEEAQYAMKNIKCKFKGNLD